MPSLIRKPSIDLPAAPDFGKMLKDYIKKNRKYQSAVARFMGVSQSVVVGYTKRKNMEIDTLWRLCYVFKKNFFLDIAALLPAEFTPITPPPVQNQNQEETEQLKLKIQELEVEVRTLKEALKVVSGR